VADRKGRLQIVVSEDEVKNREPIEVYMPLQSSRLIAEYLGKFCGLLCPGITEFLFPGRSEGHKQTRYLAKQIQTAIERETGLIVNPHLFRHFGAMLYLADNPGGYEVVRRVLGHRSTETTMSFYTGLEGKSATAHYDEIILRHRRRPGVPLHDGGPIA